MPSRAGLALFGLRPGQPFRQVYRPVQPVYGWEAVGWFKEAA